MKTINDLRAYITKHRNFFIAGSAALVLGMSVWGIGNGQGWWRADGGSTHSEISVDSLLANSDQFFSGAVAAADSGNNDVPPPPKLSESDKVEIKKDLESSQLIRKPCEEILTEYKKLVYAYLADPSNANLEKVINFCQQKDSDTGIQKPDVKFAICSKHPEYIKEFQALEDTLNSR